jgi:hypothetical protein
MLTRRPRLARRLGCHFRRGQRQVGAMQRSCNWLTSIILPPIASPFTLKGLAGLEPRSQAALHNSLPLGYLVPMIRSHGLLLCSLGFALAAVARAQTLPEAPPIAAAQEKPATEGAKPDDKEKPAEPEEVNRKPSAPLGPRQIKLYLNDGTIIAGDLTIDAFSVQTEFGSLKIPIEKLRSLTPGLDSTPGKAEKITKLVADLGADDYKVREEAHRELVEMGAGIRSELERFAADENAERRRHVGEISKALEEQAAELEDEGEGGNATWIRQDTVVTHDFTVVGKVSPSQLTVTSKFGTLNVAIADLVKAERMEELKSSLRKSVAVEGANLIQRAFKTSGVRVQVGDKVTIKADGLITMTPWGGEQQSTPDGGTNWGQYSAGIPGGALVAKIGDKGAIFKVGRSHTFTAKQAGVLQFAVAMQNQFSNEGYNYPGKYDVKLRVDPK